MKTTIKLFVVRKDGEIIQEKSMNDIYDYIQPKSISREERIKYTIPFQCEAKDLVGTYGPYTIEIIDKEIELN